MRPSTAIAWAAVLAALLASPAFAERPSSGLEIPAAVDSYPAGKAPGAALVSGPGRAGCDGAVWIEGYDFTRGIHRTQQARSKAWLGSNEAERHLRNGTGRTHSVFPLPRATLPGSGSVPCNISYYMELVCGRYGRDLLEAGTDLTGPFRSSVQGMDFDDTHEGLFARSNGAVSNLPMGRVCTARTHGATHNHERPQFVDLSFATACLGCTMPGYTGRSRGHGLAMHAAPGGKDEWDYLVALTNGDGADSIRHELDVHTGRRGSE